MKKYLILSAFFLLFIYSSHAQLKWTVKKPFEQKNFIENKGQFLVKDKLKTEEIFYAANIDGVHYYFTKKGYVEQHFAKERSKEQDKEIFLQNLRSKGNTEGENEFNYKTIEQLHEMEWEGANPQVEIVAEDLVSNYYTSTDLRDRSGKTGIKALAYKKIIYKNLYPNIDIVYEFLPEAGGIKYSLYLHPGSDVKKVKLNYPLAKSVTINKGGNVIIQSAFGKIIDHKPFTYQLNNKKEIASGFRGEDKKISFYVKDQTSSETIVIDPWTSNPNFPNNNRAFDVDYDSQGNVYAYGGDGFPYYLNKYSSSGALIWTYSANFYIANSLQGNGDFAIDITSGSIYIVEGFNANTGSTVIKVNPAGALVATFGGNPQFVEMWRISFSRCSNSAVIAGGGTSNPTYQTCYLDTNLTNLTPVQYIATTNCCHDVNCLAVDNYGNCYQITNNSSAGDGLFSNQLVKLPLPTLLPVTYNVNTNYDLNEAATNTFYNCQIGLPNGYNGITTSNTNVFTYDSYVLKKWQGSNGNQLVYKRIRWPNNADSSKVNWGGITSDDCDNIFLSDSDKVRQYDPAQNLVTSFTMPDTVFDVKLGRNNNLYVCGAGFVSSVQVSINNCNSTTVITTTQTVQNAGCGSPLGSGTVTPTGGTPPYTITWNTSPPQTGNIATNLQPGTYYVTITDNNCIPQTKVDTVVIIFNGFQTQINVTNISCNGLSTGSATATATSGVPPYIYHWQTGQNTPNVSGLPAGTYTVQVTDSTNCVSVLNVTISQPPAVSVNFGQNLIKCNGDTTSIVVIPSGGSPGYVINWSNPPGQTGTTIHGASAGNYAGTISDTNNCQLAFTYTLTQAPVLSGVTTSNYNCNVAASGTITVNPAGGNSPYTYNWQGYPGNTQNTLPNIGPGIYTVTIKDSNGCTKIFIDSIGAYSPLSLSVSGINPCNGTANGSATAVGSGGVNGVPIQYSWTGTSGTTTSVSNIGPGTYTVTATSGSCIKTAIVTLVQGPIIDSLQMKATYCDGDVSALINGPDGSGIQNPYQWYQSAATIGNANTSSYNGSVANLNTYSMTWYHNGCKYITTHLFVDVIPNIVQLKPTNIFSPNDDGRNDIYFPYENIPANVTDYVKTYSLIIFNRWGKKVFESSNITNGWNGRLENGSAADDGVYYWIAELKTNCSTNSEGILKGFVHLQR